MNQSALNRIFVRADDAAPVRSSGQRSPAPPAERELWLTAREAELLLSLLITSPLSCGDEEQAFFTKIGAYLRRF